MLSRLAQVDEHLMAATPVAALGDAVVTTGVPASPKGPADFTRFERARILGARALQISLGAPILIELPPSMIDPVEIAEREFAADVIPITVRAGPPHA